MESAIKLSDIVLVFRGRYPVLCWAENTECQLTQRQVDAVGHLEASEPHQSPFASEARSLPEALLVCEGFCIRGRLWTRSEWEYVVNRTLVVALKPYVRPPHKLWACMCSFHLDRHYDVFTVEAFTYNSARAPPAVAVAFSGASNKVGFMAAWVQILDTISSSTITAYDAIH